MSFLILILCSVSFTVAHAYGTKTVTKLSYHYNQGSSDHFQLSHYYSKHSKFSLYQDQHITNYDGSNGRITAMKVRGTVYDDSYPYWKVSVFQDGKGNVKARYTDHMGEYIWNNFSWYPVTKFGYGNGTMTTVLVSDLMGAVGDQADEIKLVHQVMLR